MTSIIYSFLTNEYGFGPYKHIEVKIGKTTDIKATKKNYTRLVKGVQILNLWKSNESLKLSECEKGVKDLAEVYVGTDNRESEKFTFLQKVYDKFSATVSLLLEATTEEKELSSIVSNMKRKEIKQETGQRVDYTGKIPKAVVFKNQTYQVRYWRDVLSVISKKLYDEKKDDFVKVLQLKAWFSKDGRKRAQGGVLRFPMKISDTPFYFEGNISANQTMIIVKKLFTLFGYNPSDLKIECL